MKCTLKYGERPAVAQPNLDWFGKAVSKKAWKRNKLRLTFSFTKSRFMTFPCPSFKDYDLTHTLLATVPSPPKKGTFEERWFSQLPVLDIDAADASGPCTWQRRGWCAKGKFRQFLNQNLEETDRNTLKSHQTANWIQYDWIKKLPSSSIVIIIHNSSQSNTAIHSKLGLNGVQ